MKTYLSPILKGLGLTVGLNGLILLYLYALSPLVEQEWGQALTFSGVTLALVTAVCLFAAIRAEKRRSVLLCGLTAGILHLPAAVGGTLVYGSRLSDHWPGYADLSWLLFLLITVAAWGLAVTVITVVKLITMTAAARRAKQGILLKISPITSARARLLAVLKGLLFTLWLHILTGLLFELLTMGGIADTMLAYIAFPCLWCLMAVAYGLGDRHNRLAYALAAGMSNAVLCLIASYFLMVAYTVEHKYRAILYLDTVLTNPFAHAEQLLAVGLLLTVGIAMLVFGVAHGRKERPATGER